jgi:lysyl-tRNA synthetase class I
VESGRRQLLCKKGGKLKNFDHADITWDGNIFYKCAYGKEGEYKNADNLRK